jgi:medium-chain acyl-[acyl-carrier-protein] hydrolase
MVTKRAFFVGRQTVCGQPATPWIERIPVSASPTMRLFCFPYAGGSTTTFLRWQQFVPPWIDVCPVQLSGRGRRIQEQPYRRIGPLVEALAEGLAPCLDLPFALFGHSMGALIAYELASHLPEGRCPRKLFVSGRRPPHILPAETMHHLPDVEFIEDLRRLGGTPEEILSNPDALELMMPVIRADFELTETYVYTARPPLACPIVSFGGWNDRYVEQKDIAQWQSFTSARFSQHMLPGDHFFINSHREELLSLVRQQLLGSADLPSRGL